MNMTEKNLNFIRHSMFLVFTFQYEFVSKINITDKKNIK